MSEVFFDRGSASVSMVLLHRYGRCADEDSLYNKGTGREEFSRF